MRILIGVLCAGLFAVRCFGGYNAVELYQLKPPPGWVSAEPAFLPGSPQVTAEGQVAGAGWDGSLSNAQFPFLALLWNSSGVPIQLNPAGAIASKVNGTNGVQQVGVAIFGASHAFLWNGTAASGVDLNPAGFALSEALATSGTRQVGYATPTSGALAHAMLWTGSASSAVDLSPAGSYGSFATGTDGVYQVGYASYTPAFAAHATLWSGTAASAVDLQPPSLVSSVAWKVSGNEQVGWGEGKGSASMHAFLWHGTADSAVDLNPAGMTSSIAWGTNGVHQVGEMTAADGFDHAVVWSGTADSAVDLSLLLPLDIKYSSAYTVDGQGNIFGIASVPHGTTYSTFAVEWQVPEPASLGLLAPLIMLVGRRTRRIH